ncbi:conserved hypothetical protein [Candidatus Nitrotoga sp. BS]|uniref:hypothetical protein n=1 Tax=Candidatus Nitrotoga sp. BS TaxID=2890408 RepID=UPI001EF1A901|nr:hypothetical protein [Candidatus Nitrotoga sp. BS]CAH1207483.1 conserved hypothetical protein [Candidatus Nitrotoga sp. BS]
MATNKSKAKPEVKPADAKHDSNTLEVAKKTDETKAEALARKVIMPSVTGAVTMQAFKKNFGEVDLMALIEATQVQIQAVKDGDMKRTESMLITQAHTLDTIFNELARRAALNMGEYINTTDTYLRLALKAQSQCRATLETLAEIKNPQPTAFIKQQNIGVNQQVNNDAVPLAHGKIKNQPNELLTKGVQHGQTLDTRAAGDSIGKNPAMAAVG